MKRKLLLLIVFLLTGAYSLFAATPVISSVSPTSGGVGTVITITGSNMTGASTVNIGGKAAIIISNTGTRLDAMVMPYTIGGSISVVTSSGTGSGGSFTVSPTVYPKAQDGAELIGTGGLGASQGSDVAVSADGSTAVVGGWKDNGDIGAVWIFVRDGDGWKQQGSKLVGSGAIGKSLQGYSVAISANGNTVIVGGTGDNATVGAAWIFTRSDAIWTQQAKLVGVARTGYSAQGASVALSADGNTAIVGGPTDYNSRGAVWFFKRTGTTWKQSVAKVVASDIVGNATFGRSVAMSADGLVAVVGGSDDNGGQGATWVFTLQSSGWVQSGPKLIGTGNIGAARQGSDVAVNADGTYIFTGGVSDNNGQGAVWAFARQGNGSSLWSQFNSKLSGTGNIGAAGQGSGIATSADGNTLIWGGAGDNNHKGAFWVFSASGSSWEQRGEKLQASNGTAQLVASTISLSGDGSQVLVGGVGGVWPFSSKIQTNLLFNPIAVKYGVADFNPGGSSSNQSIPITYTISDTTIAVIKNGKLHIKTAGATLITASQAGDANYTAATPSAHYLTVNKVGLNIKADDKTGITGKPIPTLTATYTGFVNNETAANLITKPAISTTATPSSAAGTYPITASGAVSNNYTITYSPGTLTLQQGPVTPVISFNAQAVTYGAADIDPGATSTNTTSPIVYSSSDTSVAVIVNNKVHIKKVGQTRVIASQVAGPGYNAVSTNHFLTINKVALNIKADDKTGTAGKPLPVLTATYTGFVYGETAANLTTKPALTTTATSSSAIGTYPITATGAVSDNYTITYSPGTLTLQSANPTPQTITYNQPATVRYGTPDITPNVTSTNNTIPVMLTSSDTTIASIVNGKIRVKKLGVTTITVSQNGNAYYSAAKPVSHFITVVKALLGVKADDKTGIAGQPLPALTVTYSGFVNGENVSSLSTLPVVSTTATASSPAGTYPITASGAAADNYLIGYADGTLTLTAPPAPAITSFSPTVTPTGGLVNIIGTNLNNVTSFTVNGKAGIIISKTAAKLVGLVMPGSTAGKITVSTGSNTATSAGDLAIAPNPAPNSQFGDKLVFSGNIGFTGLGTSIASSADGTTVVVGGDYDNNGMGAAWIYTRSSTGFVQQGSKLIGTGGTGSSQLEQGRSVAISADGNTVIIGSPGDNNNKGAAWVFTRIGTTWTQQGSKLVGSGSVGAARMGASVAMSADGNTAVIGGYNDNGNIGAAWIFIRQNGAWVQQGLKLFAYDSYLQSAQGVSVAMSADGNTAVVGGPSDSNNAGGAWVYKRTGTSWAQQGSKFIGSGAVGAATQGQVAISADGNTILLGGYADNNNKGAGWVFTFNGTSWSQQGTKLVGTGSSITDDQQGRSVALSVDGNTAVIGGQGDSNNKGAAWVFTRVGNSWKQPGGMLVGAGTNNGAGQGSAVAISTNGRTIFTGARNQSAVFAFTPAAKQSQTIDSFQALAPVNYGAADVNLIAVSTNPTIPITFSSSDTTIAIITSTQKVHIRKAGSVTITASQAGNGSYSDAVPVSQVLIINKIPLAVYADNKTVNQGFTSVSYTALYKGFINGDTTSSLTTLPVFTTTATSTSPDGQYPITVNGAVSSNYTFTYYPGTLTVRLKQGLPQITSISPKTGPVGTLVTLSGTNLSYPLAFTIGGKPAAIISNNGTKLVGMVMPGAVTGSVTLSTDTGSTSAPGSFAVSSTSYPSAAMPFIRTETGDVGSRFGGDVALSADGNTAIIGAPNDNVGQGAARIFVRSGTTWQQQGDKLFGTDGIGVANQGRQVAISADGNTAVVGSILDNNSVGAAWVFVRNGNTWQQQGDKLVGTGAIGQSRQAFDVAISGDGNTIVLGAPGDNNNAGAVWIFNRAGGVWQQRPKMAFDSSNSSANFGFSVTISVDGNTIAASRYESSIPGIPNGTSILVRNGDYWQQQAVLIDATGGEGGYSTGVVSLSADGNNLLIGTYDYHKTDPYDDGSYTYATIVRQYKRTNQTWASQGGSRTSPYYDAVDSGRGGTIAANANGETFLSTIPGGGNNETTVHVFNQNRDLANLSNSFASMAISADGNTALLGFSEGDIVRVFVSAQKQSQQITFNQPGPFTVGAADVALVATSTNTTLPINFSSSDTTVASIVNNKLHIKTTGVITITASQDDAVITPVSRDVTINPPGSLAAMAAGNPALAYNQNGDGSGDTQKTVIPYPNPFVSGVKLNLGDNMISNASVNVYELSESGKLVYANQYNNTSGVVQLNLDNLKSGLYVLKLTTGKQVKVFKIMKR